MQNLVMFPCSVHSRIHTMIVFESFKVYEMTANHLEETNDKLAS